MIDDLAILVLTSPCLPSTVLCTHVFCLFVFLQLCQALNLVISRLWGCLPPLVPTASNPVELSMQESASRVVCHLIGHLRFRRALAFALGSGCEVGEKIASSILSDAMLAAKHLVASPLRALARAGLQLLRLLLAFVGLGGVGLTEMVSFCANCCPRMSLLWFSSSDFGLLGARVTEESWIPMDSRLRKEENVRASMYGELSLFILFFLIRYLHPSPLFRWPMVCTQICAKNFD